MNSIGQRTSVSVPQCKDFDKDTRQDSGPAAKFHCSKCRKLLAKKNRKGMIAAEIKCPRCGTINEV